MLEGRAIYAEAQLDPVDEIAMCSQQRFHTKRRDARIHRGIAEFGERRLIRGTKTARVNRHRAGIQGGIGAPIVLVPVSAAHWKTPPIQGELGVGREGRCSYQHALTQNICVSWRRVRLG